MEKNLYFLLKGNYDYPASHRLLEIAGVITFAVFCIFLGYEINSSLLHYFSYSIAGALSLIILLAYFSADFISGFVHFLGDNFGTSETPILGPGFIRTFREHHTDPQAIVRHDWIEVNGSNCIASLFLLVPVYFFAEIQTDISACLWAFYIFMLVIFILLTNQFHKWAHMKTPPAYIAVLQKLRLVLPPDHHDIHHNSPYDKYYCITCGWLNPLLYKIHFFEFSEKVIKKIFRGRK